MSSFFQSLSRIFLHLLFITLIYFVCRIAFLMLNIDSFEGLTTPQIYSLLFAGLRFDLASIFMINSGWLFFSSFSISFSKNPNWQRFLQVLFTITNFIPLLFELADWVYFKFNHKRSTAAVLDLIGQKGDFVNLLPSFFKTYFLLFILAILLVPILFLVSRKINNWIEKRYPIQPAKGKLAFLSTSILLILVAGSTVLGIRGGTQLVPINIKNALEVAAPKYAPILINTPFSIIKSIKREKLPELNFMPEAEAQAIISFNKNYKKENQQFKPKNVVFIIIESFSKEFTGLTASPSYTPFLDSLMHHSLTFTNAYANGLHSNEGIPSILSGVPSLLNEAISNSIYSTNEIESIASILGKKGYQSTFYHGATNGSMNFDTWAKGAGFNSYFGRSEYNNERDYDGTWGIFDIPFLQYFEQGISQLKTPFCSAIFTVTSHPPFPIPATEKGKFPKGTLEIHETVGYTDYAIRLFFEKAKQASWYEETLFVITADHCSPVASNSYYSSGPGRFQIPLIFFSPNDRTINRFDSTLVNQIDILPTILDYLHYDQSFFSFGNSAFDHSIDRYYISRLGEDYEWFDKGYWMKINNNVVREMYDVTIDDSLKTNIVNDKSIELVKDQVFKNWKAFVQQYNKSLINDKMKIN